MQNVNMSVKGSKLVIEVDLKQDFGQSKSGKSTIIASTGGNQSVQGPDGPVQVGLNVYRK